MTYKEISEELKKQIYHPVYLFMGEEPYFIDQLTNYIINHALREEERSFNQTILYGKDTDVATVINNAKRFPMMSDKQVVVLKEGQYLQKFDDLEYYLQHPLASTILVVNYKYSKLDKRKKIYKLFEKNGVVLETKKLYDYQIRQWISLYVKNKKHIIDDKAAIMVNEFVGDDLSRIANELDKLLSVTPEKTLITPEIVEKNIGISKEYNAFELSKALGIKDKNKAFRIIENLGKTQNPKIITIVIAALYNYFTKILITQEYYNSSEEIIASKLKVPVFFVKEYKQAAQKYSRKKNYEVISYLREYDAKSKGSDNVSTSGNELLKELTYRILN